jgi:lantibiotic modifying enzyme
MTQKKQEAQSQNKIIAFEDKKIRRVFHNDEWYFSIQEMRDVNWSRKVVSLLFRKKII